MEPHRQSLAGSQHALEMAKLPRRRAHPSPLPLPLALQWSPQYCVPFLPPHRLQKCGTLISNPVSAESRARRMTRRRLERGGAMFMLMLLLPHQSLVCPTLPILILTSSLLPPPLHHLSFPLDQLTLNHLQPKCCYLPVIAVDAAINERWSAWPHPLLLRGASILLTARLKMARRSERAQRELPVGRKERCFQNLTSCATCAPKGST
mmetsp:Transcript_20413/g.33553  ORF Transcript_20413/g.33553 Transcript_20413/m.33553 type:complete len:207 (-) Transcript_20413:2549-3169(-)